MITLGIHVSFNGTSHDSSASIIVNKSVVAACEEERFNRQKSSQLFFPHKSIKFCLNKAKVNIEDIDLISVDGKTFKKFSTAQDHKRVFEGDKGKNTGGMGAYSPSNILDNKLEKKILDKIIKPTLKAIKDLGTEYKGFLYAGLMIVKNEPYLIEYNVRMGDPECQTILPRLESDLLNIILDCCNKNLKPDQLKWKTKNSLCIVLCSKGYPDSFKKNVLINNLEKIKISENDRIYHAGTYLDQGKIFSNGGRVLNFVSLSESFSLSRKKVVSLINDLNWSNGNYRKDIGYKVIDK